MSQPTEPSPPQHGPPPLHGDGALPRRLGIWSAAAVLVGSTIGSGIFRVPGEVAGQVGTVGALALLWIGGALVVLCGALTIAELAGMFPRSGGIFVFLKESYGPMPAFLFGWTELLVIRPSALGAIAVTFAEYARRVMGFGEVGVPWMAAVAILVLGVGNIVSIRWAAAVQNVSTVAKVGAILLLAVVAFAFGDAAQGALAGEVAMSPLGWGAFGLAMVSVMWAYDGWADVTFVAGEVKDPQRVLPRAIIGGVLAVVVVYLIINAAYLYVLPLATMAGAPLVAAEAATAVFGAVGASLVAGLVMVSTFGALNGATMTGPRIFWAMADERLFFRPIGAVHPRFKTPWAAITLACSLGIAYVLNRDFNQLAGSFVLGIWPFYALAVLGVYLLRKRRPDLARPYRTAGYPLVPAVFLLAALGMLVNSAIEDPRNTLVGFAIILAGIPVYYIWKAVRKDAP